MVLSKRTPRIKTVPLSPAGSFRIKRPRKISSAEYSKLLKSGKTHLLWKNQLREYLYSRPRTKKVGDKTETLKEALADYLAYAKMRRADIARKNKK